MADSDQIVLSGSTEIADAEIEGGSQIYEILAPLGRRHRDFVRGMICGLSPDDAAAKAGYVKEGIAAYLLASPSVISALEKVAPFLPDARRALSFLAPAAIQVTRDAMRSEVGKDALKAAQDVLDRLDTSGIRKTAKLTVNGAEMIRAALAKQGSGV